MASDDTLDCLHHHVGRVLAVIQVMAADDH